MLTDSTNFYTVMKTCKVHSFQQQRNCSSKQVKDFSHEFNKRENIEKQQCAIIGRVQTRDSPLVIARFCGMQLSL